MWCHMIYVSTAQQNVANEEMFNAVSSKMISLNILSFIMFFAFAVGSAAKKGVRL